ncbi:MAG: 4Fe-4S dicluster domain-containing protein [Pseudomonadota bacterium]
MDLIRKIYESGVVGAGGAGFPTHIKLDCSVEYLIINGAECEPLLKTDQYLMRNKSVQLVEAAELVGELTGASRIFFAIKKKYIREADSLRKEILEQGSKAEIFQLDSIYPAGDEHMLVYDITGRTVPPGGIPLNTGVVVSNVNTIYNIYEASQSRPVTSRYVTVTGEVRKPALVKAPLGTPVVDCIKAAGGTGLSDFNVIMGGPMMGKMLSGRQINDRYITKTDSGVIVIPQDHYLSNRASVSIEHMINQAKSACIQCSYCTDMCPRYLEGHKLRPHRIMRSISLGGDEKAVYTEAFLCSECGICEMYACPMGLSPRKINIHIKGLLRSKGIKPANTPLDMGNTEMRAMRKVPVSRLINRLDMAAYDREIPDEVIEVRPCNLNVPLRQHIGIPAAPIVNCGDSVGFGQLIAVVEYGRLGANIHAGIEGIVEAVSSDSILINSLGQR